MLRAKDDEKRLYYSLSNTFLGRMCLSGDMSTISEEQWKITDEDWRNREKWNQYEQAVDEMIQKTSTEFAPWYILESVDKKYARIKALEIVVEELKKACESK